MITRNQRIADAISKRVLTTGRKVLPQTILNLKQYREKPPEKPKISVFKTYLTNYLNSRKAISDFNKFRKATPGLAITFAADRIWGKPKESEGGKIDIKILIPVLQQALTGKKPMLTEAKNIEITTT